MNRLPFAFVAAIVALAGCSALPVPSPDPHQGGFLPHPAAETLPRDVDLFVTARDVVSIPSGSQLLRIRFSFVSYRGYLAEDDVHRSTGTLFLPVGSDGAVSLSGNPVTLLTEYPPGASREPFPFLAAYGEDPAARLGIPAAVVDVRGPVVSSLAQFTNPDDPADNSFTSERQFAYSMLRSYQQVGDEALLWEYQAAGAWLRAILAVDELLGGELGSSRHRFLLAGQDYGALAAVQAAAADEGVAGVVSAGWPLDWWDYHSVRWQRWERRSDVYPLDVIAPTIWGDSREVASFLASTWRSPDPGCPTCSGTGLRWRRQYDLLELRRSGRLPALFFLEADSDPDLPLDLTARASAPAEEVASLPQFGPGRFPGPFATDRPLPLDDQRILSGEQSTLARDDSAEAVVAWAQSLSGYRDLPRVVLVEEVIHGDLVVTARVAEGNAVVIGASLHVLEADSTEPFDFKARAHRRTPAPLGWREYPMRWGGEEIGFVGQWKGRFPLLAGTNQAYYVRVQTRVGDMRTEHSLPVRPIWHRGDPAAHVARP